jgi:hypothetical protein
MVHDGFLQLALVLGGGHSGEIARMPPGRGSGAEDSRPLKSVARPET